MTASPGLGGTPVLRLHNTAAHEVVPVALDPTRPVGIYTCGPTVYRPVHLGNLRSYLLADCLRRLLLALGYRVKHVKNITDVGHMRQELLDRGEDKLVAEALRAGVSPGEIAAHYTDAFWRDEQRLNVQPADVFPRATDHVPRMLEITQRLLERGHAYERGGNVYFRVASFARYGELGGAISREGLRQGVRAEADPLKDDPRDFALWKRAESGRKELVWPSPWGPGFPGWHIECTAMATQHLGDQVDIHTGGVDNVFPHHEDERAQSEAFTGVAPFARVWLHGQHLLADGLKMAKSTGNAYTLDGLLELCFDPLAFRYLCLTAHYRARLNFTFTSLRAAQTGLRRLRAHVWHWTESAGPSTVLSQELSREAAERRDEFWRAAADDLALPRCLAMAWSLVRGPWSGLPMAEKAGLARDFDRLLGLDLGRRPERRPADPFRGAFSSPAAITDHTSQPNTCEVSVNLLVQPDEDLSAVERCVTSLVRHSPGRDLEVVLVDATGSPEAHARLAQLAAQEAVRQRLRLVWLDHDPGAGGGRNAGLRASRGRVVALIDASVEFLGDALGPLVAALEEPSVGAAGPFGLVTADFRHFYELPEAPPDQPWPREVDALQNYLFAFHRVDLPRIGWLDEHFRFYRILDLDLSCAIRARVGRVVTLSRLPVVRHRHAVWEALSPGDREERSRKNFGRFLKRWDHHPGLPRPVGAREAHALEAGEHAHAAVHG
jgi:cysteinyl-tRNA synthetase